MSRPTASDIDRIMARIEAGHVACLRAGDASHMRLVDTMEDRELVYWDSQEWAEDPDLLPMIEAVLAYWKIPTIEEE